MLQRDDPALPCTTLVAPILKRHLQSGFDRGGTIVGVEHTIQRWRQNASELLCKFLRRRVRETRKDHVLQLAGLSGDRIGDGWMRMTMDIHPPRRNRINE